jgi:hypothetical protein
LHAWEQRGPRFLDSFRKELQKGLKELEQSSKRK